MRTRNFPRQGDFRGLSSCNGHHERPHLDISSDPTRKETVAKLQRQEKEDRLLGPLTKRRKIQRLSTAISTLCHWRGENYDGRGVVGDRLELGAAL